MAPRAAYTMRKNVPCNLGLNLEAYDGSLIAKEINIPYNREVYPMARAYALNFVADPNLLFYLQNRYVTFEPVAEFAADVKEVYGVELEYTHDYDYVTISDLVVSGNIKKLQSIVELKIELLNNYIIAAAWDQRLFLKKDVVAYIEDVFRVDLTPEIE